MHLEEQTYLWERTVAQQQSELLQKQEETKDS